MLLLMMDEKVHGLKERKYKQNNSIREALKIEKYTVMEPDYTHTCTRTHVCTCTLLLYYDHHFCSTRLIMI